MTEKRFYLMNVEDPLHEYGRWCKPVLEDGETGKQYEGALEVMNLLNTLHEENNAFKNIIQHFIVKEFKITKEDIIQGKGGDATDFSSVIDEFFNNEVNISEIQIELKGEKTMTDLTIEELHSILTDLIEKGHGDSEFRISSNKEGIVKSLPKSVDPIICFDHVIFSDYR